MYPMIKAVFVDLHQPQKIKDIKGTEQNLKYI